jgi:outer membrane receptor protein involved in Fe transport
MRSGLLVVWLALVADVARADDTKPPNVLPPENPVLKGPAVAPAADARAPVVEIAPEPVEVAPVEGLAGLVVAADDQSPVAGAFVFFGDQEVRTDEQGRFQAAVPPGTYAITIAFGGFESQTLDAVVRKGGAVPPTYALVRQQGATDEIVVEGARVAESTAALLEERKEAAVVTDVIAAEQMARTGDSSAAAAVKRVTGLTVVGGQYVYVRGLGERYSATLLDGASLPSTEPERRVVPLDMFPTGLLGSVVVQKTYSPDMPAEFGGGVVQLRTRDIPDQFMARFGATGAWVQGTTFRDATIGNGGPTDWLGFDGSHRDVPDAIADASADQAIKEGDMFSDRGFTAQELEELGEQVKSDRWGLSEQTLLPNGGLNAVVGDGISIFGGRAGYFAGAMYDHGWDLDQSRQAFYTLGSGDTLEESHAYDFETLTRTVRMGGLLDLQFAPSSDHEIGLTTLLNRNTDDETRIYEGYNRDVDSDIRVSRVRFVERQLLLEQAHGAHDFGVFAVDWRAALSRGTRSEPDTREWRQDLDVGTGEWLLSTRPEGNSIFYNTLVDDTIDLGLDVTKPLGEAKVKAGAWAVDRTRTSDVRRFKFQEKGPAAGDPDVISQQPDAIFVKENIGQGAFQLEEQTRESDNYVATQEIRAAYALADVPIGSKLRILAGARVESSVQEVKTFQLFTDPPVEIVADLSTTDVLPSASLTYGLSETQQVRLGYGRTVNRPDFRELSPMSWNDVTGGREIFGNADLQRALIDNLDARWEWYPADGETISFGAFYKRFTDPIEQIVVVSAQQSITYTNAEGADNYGVELDARKFIPGVFPGFYAAGNVSLIRSRVRIGETGGIETSSERPLQGASPYVVNAEIGRDAEEGTDLTLLYNVVGPRIDEVGALGAPDVYERPVHEVDLVVAQPLGGGFSFSIRGRNLLNALYQRTQGGHVVEELREGRSVNLSLTWKPTE